MSLVDVVIIILLLLGMFLGFKRGVILETVDTLGFVIAVVLAFLLKNKLSIIMYENLPFFNVDFIFKGASVINILIYEIIAFLLVLLLTLIIVKVLKLISRLIEGVLKATVILSIPSKILGALVGLVKWVLIVFVASYILSMFNYDYMKDSKISNYLLSNSKVLSRITDNTVEVYKEFSSLKDKYEDSKDYESLNRDALDLFLEKKIITLDSVKVLKEKGKLKFKGLDKIIERYEEKENGTN